MTTIEIRKELKSLYEQLNQIRKEEQEIADKWIPSNVIWFMLGIGFIPLMIGIVLEWNRLYQQGTVQSQINSLEKQLEDLLD